MRGSRVPTCTVHEHDQHPVVQEDKWPGLLLPFRTLCPSLPLHSPLLAGAQAAFHSFSLLHRCCRLRYSTSVVQTARAGLPHSVTHFPFKDGTNCPKLPTLPLHFLLAYLRLLLCISVSLYPHIDCIPKARRNQADFPRDRDDHPKDSYVRTPRCLWTLPIAHPVCSI